MHSLEEVHAGLTNLADRLAGITNVDWPAIAGTVTGYRALNDSVVGISNTLARLVASLQSLVVTNATPDLWAMSHKLESLTNSVGRLETMIDFLTAVQNARLDRIEGLVASNNVMLQAITNAWGRP